MGRTGAEKGERRGEEAKRRMFSFNFLSYRGRFVAIRWYKRLYRVCRGKFSRARVEDDDNAHRKM